MKNLWIALSLCALITSTAVVARDQDDLKNRAYWNPITINNHAPYDIAYSVYASGHYNKGYLVKTNTSDVYHSGFGDKRAQFFLAACVERDANGNCMTLISRGLPNYYNAEEIATINIKTVYDVEVICLDGTNNSCIAK